MTFQQKLTSILENEKFIEYSGTYSHDFLKKLFLQNISGNIDIFIQETYARFSEQEIWSFVNFLSSVYEDKKWDFNKKDKEKLTEYTKKWLYDPWTHDDVYTSLLKLLSLLSIKQQELIDLSTNILANRKAYTILEALSFDLSESIPNEKIFLEVFLTTLNAPRWNYLGLSWHEKFWEIIAKHPNRKWFLGQLLLDSNKDAADEFLTKWEKASEALLNSLDESKSTIEEIITFFRDFFIKLSPERTWYGHESHKAKELLELVLKYAQKNTISLNFDLPFLFDEDTFWYTEDILAQYISKKDILKFYEKVGFGEMHIIRLYEAIKYWKREDKEIILQTIEWLFWFSEKMREVEIARENWQKQSEASTKKFHDKIKREIREWIKYTKENEISPRVLEYFFRDDFNKLFKGKYREEAIKQLKRFLDWKLFSFDWPVYQRFIEEDGKINYRWGFWYGVNFFTDALETAAKSGINVETPKIRTSILRWFLLHNTSELNKLYWYIWEKISDKEADMLLTWLEKWHISNIRYHLSGQNIFPVFEKYEKIFLHKKHREKVVELIKSIITDEDFEEWRRASPLDYIKWDLRKEMLPWLKSHWESIVDKKRNYIETFDRWGLILKLNMLLIEENDDEAIQWMLDQLQSAKVQSLSFEDRHKWQYGNLHFRWVSDIESELDFDRTLWKWLKDIDARKYQKELLSIIKHALNLLKKEEWQETKLLSSYARYLINWVIWLFIDSKTISVRDTLDELNKINNQSNWNAKYLFGFSLRNFQESKIKSLNEKEKDILLYEIINERNRRSEEEGQKEKQSDWTGKKIIRLWTEWPSDKIHIENAWLALFPGIRMPFEVLNWYSADHIKKLLTDWILEENEIMFCIFDFDEKWAINCWHDLSTKKENKTLKWKIIENNSDKCLTLQNLNESKFALLLPTFYEISSQVISDDCFLAMKDFSLLGACYEWKPKLDIELMFFGINGDKWNESLFREMKSHNWWNYWKFEWDSRKKQAFWLDIQELAIKEWVLLRDLYKNFKPLFSQLGLLIELINKKSPE